MSHRQVSYDHLVSKVVFFSEVNVDEDTPLHVCIIRRIICITSAYDIIGYNIISWDIIS